MQQACVQFLCVQIIIVDINCELAVGGGGVKLREQKGDKVEANEKGSFGGSTITLRLNPMKREPAGRPRLHSAIFYDDKPYITHI